MFKLVIYDAVNNREEEKFYEHRELAEKDQLQYETACDMKTYIVEVKETIDEVMRKIRNLGFI